jgi:hypothetical protein
MRVFGDATELIVPGEPAYLAPEPFTGLECLPIPFVLCQLGDLLDTIGAESMATHNGFSFIKGNFTIVLIGDLQGRQLWHVCSFSEATMASEKPGAFTESIRESKPYGLDIQRTVTVCSQDAFVLVGALVNPHGSGLISPHDFDYNLNETRASQLHQVPKEKNGLQFDRAMLQAQLSMGAQGPQGTLSFGAEASRRDPQYLPPFSPSRIMTTFGEALRSQILLYQTSTRVVSEQNLFNVAVSTIIRTRRGDSSYQHRLQDVIDMKAALSINSELYLTFQLLNRILANPVCAYSQGCLHTWVRSCHVG